MLVPEINGLLSDALQDNYGNLSIFRFIMILKMIPISLNSAQV